MKREKIDSISRPDASKDEERLLWHQEQHAKCDKPRFIVYVGTAKVETTNPSRYDGIRNNKRATR